MFFVLFNHGSGIPEKSSTTRVAIFSGTKVTTQNLLLKWICKACIWNDPSDGSRRPPPQTHTLTLSQGKWSRQWLHAWVLSQCDRRGTAVHWPQDRSCWLSVTLWESAALFSTAYLNQSFYKWTFTVHASLQPSSQIRPYYVPISRGWSEEERGAKGHAFFPFTTHGKKNLACLRVDFWPQMFTKAINERGCMIFFLLLLQQSYLYDCACFFSNICPGLFK